MDADRFDAFARSLTTSLRRRTLAAAVGTALAALRQHPDATAHGLSAKCKKLKGAKKKKCLEKARKHAAQDAANVASHHRIDAEGRKKRKKKKGSSPTTPVSLPPISPSPPSCPQGQRLCQGTCQSVQICCDDGDCAGGRTCQDGTCECPPARPHICAGSTVCRECCGNSDCPECQQCGTDQTCAPVADDIGCGDNGKCLNGTCNPPPGCYSQGHSCGVQEDCCSGVCYRTLSSLCFTYGLTGDRCHHNVDCLSDRCVGYRCQSACSHSDGSPCEDSVCRECQNGTCVTKADDTFCILPEVVGGKCLNGTCNPAPQCLSRYSVCTDRDDTPCCAGSCDPETSTCLTPGERGDTCNGNDDCRSGNCVGYRCQPPILR